MRKKKKGIKEKERVERSAAVKMGVIGFTIHALSKTSKHQTLICFCICIYISLSLAITPPSTINAIAPSQYALQ